MVTPPSTSAGLSGNPWGISAPCLVDTAMGALGSERLPLGAWTLAVEADVSLVAALARWRRLLKMLVKGELDGKPDHGV